jgi:4-hydroxy-2-oxoheptanedioate aldolase
MATTSSRPRSALWNELAARIEKAILEHMRPNKIREILRAGRPSVGTHLQSAWPSFVEVVGHTGKYDYVEFVAEYAPFDLFALENICRAAELHGLGSMIKVDQEPRRFLAQRAIGSGFEAVLFADVRDAADARECVRAVRPETPEDGGTHGVAARRFAYMKKGATQEYVQALRDVVVAIMIEKQSAVDQLEEILATPGIDMVQWGPADYCMSIGKPGTRNAPEVREAEQRVIATCLRMGVIPRAEVETPADAGYYLDLGVRHFCLGSDINILYNWLAEEGGSLRKVMSQASVVAAG